MIKKVLTQALIEFSDHKDTVAGGIFRLTFDDTFSPSMVRFLRIGHQAADGWMACASAQTETFDLDEQHYESQKIG